MVDGGEEKGCTRSRYSIYVRQHVPVSTKTVSSVLFAFHLRNSTRRQSLCMFRRRRRRLLLSTSSRFPRRS
jgi:hypothetical protein